jgi:hypothetical protein
MPERKRRRGAALLLTLVTLAVLSTLLAAIAWQIVANRRHLERRHYRYQSHWLARAGVELAAARLLADPAYRGESATPIPQSKVKIEVRRDATSADLFHITSEARYPDESREPVVRSVSRDFRRVQDGDKVRLEPP